MPNQLAIYFTSLNRISTVQRSVPACRTGSNDAQSELQIPVPKKLFQ